MGGLGGGAEGEGADLGEEDGVFGAGGEGWGEEEEEGCEGLEDVHYFFLLIFLCLTRWICLVACLDVVFGLINWLIL